MQINKEQVKKEMIKRAETILVERELTLDYMERMKVKATKETKPAFDAEIDKLKKQIESDKNFLKDF